MHEKNPSNNYFFPFAHRKMLSSLIRKKELNAIVDCYRERKLCDVIKMRFIQKRGFKARQKQRVVQFPSSCR